MRTFFLLPCSCGNKIPIERAQAGQIVRCACGAELDVPTMQAIGRLEQAAATAGSAEPAASRWGLWQGLVLLGITITLPALGWAVYLGITWPKPLDINALSPVRTLSVWHLFQGDVAGPGLRDDERALAQATTYRHWMIVAVAVVCLGLAVAAGSWLLVRPGTGKASGTQRDRPSGG